MLSLNDPAIERVWSVAMRLSGVLRIICASVAIWIAGGVPASATRNVVMLFDERPELPGLAALDAEFVRTLKSNSTERIVIYREEMDRSRFDGDYQVLLRDFLRTKYASKKIDAVFAMFGPALDFLLDHGAEIFPGASIVFCGIDRPELGDRRLPPHVRGVLLKREFAPTLELALGLHAQTKHVAVVAGTSAFDAQLLEQAKREFEAYADRVAFRYLTALPLQRLLAELAQLPPQSLVLYTTLFRDGAGETYIPHDVASLVSAAANAPVYGFLDQYLGRGIVGGSLYSTSRQGAEAAKLVLQVLAEVEPARPEPRLLEAPAGAVQFDWRQVQRWGIRAASLPPGSEIHFRDPTLWDQHKGLILAAGGAILLQAALIGWLLHERQYRHRAERRERETMSELMHLNRVATAGELVASIAHEVNQPLAGIAMSARAAVRWLRAETPNVERAVASLEQVVAATHHAGDVITHIRALFRKDSDVKSAIEINDLVLAILAMVQTDLLTKGIEVKTELDERRPVVQGDAVQLEQVVLNLVLNAADAMNSVERRLLTVQTEQSGPGQVRVSVEDTGIGIDPSNVNRIFERMFTTKANGMGMGLSICRSIVERHGGRIWVSPGADGGAAFHFDLPTLTRVAAAA